MASMPQLWKWSPTHFGAPSSIRPTGRETSSRQHQLAEKHGASRPTIRRALRELRLRGLIETRQGKGAFVRRPTPVGITLFADNYRRHQRDGRAGFNALVREQGHEPSQEIIEVATIPAPHEVASRLSLPDRADVLVRRLRFLVDELPVQLVSAYYAPALAAGSLLEQPALIAGGAHSELRRLGVHISRLVEDFVGARLPDPEEERALRLPSGVPVTRNIRTAYAGDQAVDVLDTIAHGEVVSHRFEIDL